MRIRYGLRIKKLFYFCSKHKFKKKLNNDYRQTVSKIEEIMIFKDENMLFKYISNIRALFMLLHPLFIFQVQLLVNTLIHRGANPSASNTELKTALHFAVERNFRGVCSKLLEYGAYPNSKDRYTITPYTIAYDKGNDTVAAMLISYMSNKE